jgi:glucose-1-phosphatase
MNKIKFSIIVLLLLAISTKQNHAQELELVKVVDVSRHGLRVPLQQYLRTLDLMTGDGYHWKRDTVPGSHLSPKGDTLERFMGEYFRLWFREQGFELDSADIYLGASSKQRTVATATAFMTGMCPGMALPPVDYKKKNSTYGYGYLDPDYLPLLNGFSVPDFDTMAFKYEAYRELGELTPPSYVYLENMLRISHSEYGSEHFDNHVGVNLVFYDSEGGHLEPTMVGGLKHANMASDAFILAYLNDTDSILGRPLEFYDWKELASIKDLYSRILFSQAPIIAVNVSHCMLNRIYSEMASGHKYAFFCTHDSMIEALLAALKIKPYELSNTLEKTPIGVKLLFEQWAEKNCMNPKKYVRVRLVYQSSEQIRKMQHLTLDNPPMSCELSFTDIQKAPNGMYPYDEFMNHLQHTLKAYNATAKGMHPWE